MNMNTNNQHNNKLCANINNDTHTIHGNNSVDDSNNVNTDIDNVNNNIDNTFNSASINNNTHIYNSNNNSNNANNNNICDNSKILLMKTDYEGGHFGAAGMSGYIADYAYDFAFLYKTMGLKL